MINRPAAKSRSVKLSTALASRGETVRTHIPSIAAVSSCVYSCRTTRLRSCRSSVSIRSRQRSTSRTKMTASSKLRIGRLDAQPRPTGELSNEGERPTWIDA